MMHPRDVRQAAEGVGHKSVLHCCVISGKDHEQKAGPALRQRMTVCLAVIALVYQFVQQCTHGYGNHASVPYCCALEFCKTLIALVRGSMLLLSDARSYSSYCVP